MSDYTCADSSSNPELWPDFMQEASNSSVWQLNDFQEAPRMIAVEVYRDSDQTI